MASTNTPLELDADQRATVSMLALAMKAVAGVLLVLGGMTLVAGLFTPVSITFLDIFFWAATVIEGAVTCLLGLVMLSSSADIRFMVETKFASIHLGNALRNLTVFYKGQFFLALFLVVVAPIRLIVG